MRVVWKRIYGFSILVNKVGGNHTFRVKILIGVHKCGRLFGTKNGNKELVLEVVMEKFRNVGKMTTNEIIDDVEVIQYWDHNLEGFENKTNGCGNT